MTESTWEEQEEQTEVGSVVYALAPSSAFAEDGICFAATAEGLLRSTDYGATWEPAYAALNLPEALPTPAVAVSPAFSRDHTVFSGVAGSVLRSTDGGQRVWQVAMLPTPPPTVSTLCVSPNYEEDGILFAASMQDGVFRSANRGSNWVAWNFGLVDLNVLCLALSPNFAADETLFAGTETGLFRSTNGGRAWREVALPEEAAPVLALALSPHYPQDGIMFVGTESEGLWITADRGKNWTRSEGLPAGAVNGLVLDRTYPEPARLLVLMDTGMYLSEDNGESWLALDAELPEDVAPMCVAAPYGLAPNAALLIGLSDGTVTTVGCRTCSI
jgi:photosystem II stability/assembly factor-like uncharacterized protein